MCPEVARAPHVPRSPLPYPREAGGGRAVHLSVVHKERSGRRPPTEKAKATHEHDEHVDST